MGAANEVVRPRASHGVNGWGIGSCGWHFRSGAQSYLRNLLAQSVRSPRDCRGLGKAPGFR